VPFKHPLPFAPELRVLAVDAVMGDRPAVWIDDNHTPAGQHWATERAAPTLLVSLDPRSAGRGRTSTTSSMRAP
jgi:hypothetical protein